MSSNSTSISSLRIFRSLAVDALRISSCVNVMFILKNDDPDVDLHDMIDYELYIREYS